MKVICLTNIFKVSRLNPLDSDPLDREFNLTPGKVYEMIDDENWRFIIDDLGILQYYHPKMFMDYDIWRQNKIDKVLKDV